MAVSIEISEERGVRYLHFGSRWIQGAMRIARPWTLELEYTRDMLVPLLLRPGVGFPKNALLIGLGTASLLKFLHRHRPLSRLTVVELEDKVITAARRYFKLPEESRRLKVETAEGSEFLAASTTSYELILVDGFDARGPSGPLQTLAFYRVCRSRLSEQGVLSVNLLSRNRGFQSSVERISNAFGGRMLMVPPGESGNAVVLAAAGTRADATASELAARSRRLRAATGLDLAPTLARLARSSEGGESRLEL